MTNRIFNLCFTQPGLFGNESLQEHFSCHPCRFHGLRVWPIFKKKSNGRIKLLIAANEQLLCKPTDRILFSQIINTKGVIETVRPKSSERLNRVSIPPKPRQDVFRDSFKGITGIQLDAAKCKWNEHRPKARVEVKRSGVH